MQGQGPVWSPVLALLTKYRQSVRGIHADNSCSLEVRDWFPLRPPPWPAHTHTQTVSHSKQTLPTNSATTATHRSNHRITPLVEHDEKQVRYVAFVLQNSKLPRSATNRSKTPTLSIFLSHLLLFVCVRASVHTIAWWQFSSSSSFLLLLFLLGGPTATFFYWEIRCWMWGFWIFI